MFTHGFGRILLGQSVCTVVGIVLQPCDAIDRPDRGTPDSPLAQEMGMNTPPDTDPTAIAEFSKFYSTIHVPEVVANNPGFVRGTRYELLQLYESLRPEIDAFRQLPGIEIVPSRVFKTWLPQQGQTSVVLA
jgi:hypothetical protein